MTDSSYHDLTVETPDIAERSISDLPYGLTVTCCRAGGWSLWKNIGQETEENLAGEFGDKWLVLRCNGVVILDSRANPDAKGVGYPEGWDGTTDR